MKRSRAVIFLSALLLLSQGKSFPQGIVESGSSSRSIQSIQSISPDESGRSDRPVESSKLQEGKESHGNKDSKEVKDSNDLSESGQSIQPIQIEGDKFEFFRKENKVVVEGHVKVIRQNTVLTCDRAEVFQDTGMAVAKGHVVLRSSKGVLTGKMMTYNFNTMMGNFVEAGFQSNPFYGSGESMSKVGENHLVLKNAYLTTCDLRHPHYRMKARRVDVYPGDIAVARNARFIVGKIPLIYIPKYTKDISDKRPRVIFTPGKDKDWGIFLLQAWQYYFNDDLKGTLHLDYRTKKDFAWGVDLDYNTHRYGNGQIRTYYMNERNITSKYPWEEKPSPTIEKERFKVEWRHQWDIDENTSAIWQYYRMSDINFLKDYFEREYEKDQNPETYFVFKRIFPLGLFSFRADARVNRFVSAVERLPELKYEISNTEIGNTNVYFDSETMYSNLVSKSASPSENRTKTMRVDTENTLSYPMKIGFVEFKPFVGGRETYYSKTKEPDSHGYIRGIFKTGADLSTKFFKIYDVHSKLWGVDINRLRHVVTPSIAYVNTADPTVPSSKLNVYDDVENEARKHNLVFRLENKLQTKRDLKSVDLVRIIVSTTFLLKEQNGKGGFNDVTTDWEFKPVDWLTFYADTAYDPIRDDLTSANFDLYLHDKENSGKWSFDFGKRYSRDADDQITTEFTYKFNPKWKLRAYNRFDIDTGINKEQEFTLTRDLHCWEMDINFNETRGDGTEIWIVFRLKAFPEMGFDFGTSFNKRKAGSQSSP